MFSIRRISLVSMAMFGMLALLSLACVTPMSVLASKATPPPVVSVDDNLAIRLNRHIFERAPRPPSSTPMSRLNSISFIAIHDAINSINPVYQTIYTDVKVVGQNKKANINAAMLGAFNTSRYIGLTRLPNQYKADVLLFTPAEVVPYHTALRTFILAELALINDSADNIARGMRIGHESALSALEVRETDGYNVAVPVPVLPCGIQGNWCSWTETANAPDQQGITYRNWGNMQPFALESASSFETPAPPKVGDAMFEVSLNHTMQYGSILASVDPTYLKEVHTWSLGAGGELGARIVDKMFSVGQLSMTVFDTVALFGRLYVGNADALIHNIHNKAKHNSWRPRQAIQALRDSTWEPYLTTPLSQEYPCGHCEGTAGALYPVMLSLGFDEFPFAPVPLVMPTGQRAVPYFKSFSNIIEHVNNARLYGGMHFPFAIRQGSARGIQIANEVFNKMFLKK